MLPFRVIAQGEWKEVSGHTFKGFGAHCDAYHCNYLTAAAALGMTKEDVDSFVKRLDKVLEKCLAGSKGQSAKCNGKDETDNPGDELCGLSKALESTLQS